MQNEIDFISLIKKKFEEDGYSVKVDEKIYHYEADLIAEKIGQKHLIEIKSTLKNALSSFVYSKQLMELPEISFIWLVVPENIITDDVISVIKDVGFGLFKISQDKPEMVFEAKELQKGRQTYN